MEIGRDLADGDDAARRDGDVSDLVGPVAGSMTRPF
jgi:hypothetical protein